MQPQFSSTPASAGGVAGVGGVAGGGAGAGGMAGGGAGQREALGPLTNQENYKQQVRICQGCNCGRAFG